MPSLKLTCSRWRDVSRQRFFVSALILVGLAGCGPGAPLGGNQKQPRQDRALVVDPANKPGVKVPWQVAVDPATELPEVPDALTLAPSFPISLAGSDEVFFPYTLRPLALVKDSKRARVFDLAKGAELGQVLLMGHESPFREAISPNGQLWAQVITQASNNVSLIRIGSLESGREMISIGVGGDADLGRVSFLQFATPDRLVAISRGNTRAQAWVIDAELGKFHQPNLKFDLAPQSFNNPMLVEDGAACSPGGKYLAAIIRSQLAADIVVYDLDSGARVGALVMNDAEQGFAPMAVAFSGDGKHLAALGSKDRQHRLHVWEITNGALVQSASLSEQQLKQDHPNYNPQSQDYPLRWVPSGAGWGAFGRYVIRPGSTKFDSLAPSQFDNRNRLIVTHELAIGWQAGPREFALDVASFDINNPNRQVVVAPKPAPMELAANNSPPMPVPMPSPAVAPPPMPPPATQPRDIPKGVEVVAPPVEPEVQPTPTRPRVKPERPPTAEEQRAAMLAKLDKAPWQPMIDGPLKSQAFLPAPKFPVKNASSTLFFPQQRGRFLPARTQGVWQVFDLASGKTLGDLGKLNINVYITAVDDAGERFAYLPYEDSGHHDNIAVYHFKTKATQLLPLPHTKGRNIDFLTFDRAGNLIAVAGNSYTSTVHSYPPGAEDPQWSVEVPFYLDDEGVHAISPGGRFLALAGHDVGSMVDLQSGKVIQQFRSPFQRQGHLPQALRFSPDGQHLAAVNRSQLLIWSMETGKIVTDRVYTFDVLAYSQNSNASKTPLEWLGNEMLLLYGQRIADRQNGTLFYIIAQDRERSLKPLTDNSILAVNGSEDFLANMSLPREKVAAALAVARKAPSEVVPPLRKLADVPLPPPLEDKGENGVPLAVDAPTAAARPYSPIDLKLEPGYESQRFVITDPAVGQAVVEVEHVYDFLNGNKNLPISRAEPLGPERTVRLDFYDLATGNKAQSLELPGRSRLLDVSPDGSLVLIGDWTGISSRRLDVWAPKLTPQHALGFQPSEMVYDARFVDKRHILVYDNDKYVTLWRLPACEPVYRRKSFRFQLSPTREYWTDYSSNVIDSLTGKALVRVKLPDRVVADNIGAGTLNFSARGDSLWANVSLPRGYEWAGAHFVRWNLAGEVIDKQEVVHTSSPISLLLNDRVLILDGSQANTGALLFNVANQKFIGHTAESPNNYYVANDGSLWGRRGTELRQFTLKDLALDENAELKYEDILLLGEGKSIAIEADTKGITDQAAVEAALKELAAQQKLVVDPAAPLKLRFFFQEGIVGGLKIQTPTMTITDGAGNEHWRQQYREFKFEVAFDGAAWIKKYSLPGRLYKTPTPTIFKGSAGR